MSNPVTPSSYPAEGEPALPGGVELLIGGRQAELGGATIHRVLPYVKRRMIGPWTFFDHLGPVLFKPGEGLDVPPHPHINLATVSYMFEGQMVHRDSLGKVQPLEPGAINLMVAGRGIAHSERTAPEMRVKSSPLHALQLWLALPEDQEEIEPAFYHHPAGELPGKEMGGVRLRVLMGEGYGLKSPVEILSPTFYAEALLSPGARLALPVEVQERGVYPVTGAVNLNGQPLPAYTMAVCREGAEILIEAREPSQVAIIGGTPLGPRHIYWNFVSSRRERIEQAKRDWQEGRFPRIPGETEFVPLPASRTSPPPNYV